MNFVCLNNIVTLSNSVKNQKIRHVIPADEVLVAVKAQHFFPLLCIRNEDKES